MVRLAAPCTGGTEGARVITGTMLLFGLGSVCGMAALSWAVSVPMRLSARHLTRCHHWLNAGVAVVSVALGLNVVAAQWFG